MPETIETAPEPDRWIKAYWDEHVKETFTASLTVLCMDRRGLIMDITTQLDAMHVNINSFSTKTSKDGRATINVSISVNGTEHLKNVMGKIAKINGVIDVERSNV